MGYTVLYGGTFHPVHNGHVQMAAAAAEWPQADEVWVIPSFSPVHKAAPNAKQMAQHRLQMCKLGFADLPKVRICDIELAEPLSGYTYDTLQRLKTLYPQKKFAFLVGTDMLFCFERWYKAPQLLQQMHLLVVLRAGDSETQLQAVVSDLQSKYGAKITVLPQNVQGVSSTQVRERLQSGQNVADLVPLGVLQYMQQNGLYGLGE